MKKVLGVLLAVLASAAPALAQSGGARVRVSLASDYDLDSATYVYPVTTGMAGVLSGPRRRVGINVQTSGSSTTISATTAGTKPFLGMVAGDELYFNFSGRNPLAGGGASEYGYVIVTRTDDDNVVVNEAVDITTAQGFSWRQFSVLGTAAAGWVPVAGFDVASFAWQIKQSDATSIDVIVECQDTATSASYSWAVQVKNYTVYTCAVPTTGGCDTWTASPATYDRCRLGFKINTDTSDAGANLEKISAQFVGKTLP